MDLGWGEESSLGLNSPGESDPLTHTQVWDLLILSLPGPKLLSPARVLPAPALSFSFIVFLWPSAI